MSKPTKTQIREGMQWSERRRVMAVGRAKGDDVEIAVLCMFCEEWIDGPPEGPYVESHGLCEDCRDEHYPELGGDDE